MTSEQTLELTVMVEISEVVQSDESTFRNLLTESVDTEILLRLGPAHLKGNVFKTTANLAANRLKLSDLAARGCLPLLANVGVAAATN